MVVCGRIKLMKQMPGIAMKDSLVATLGLLLIFAAVSAPAVQYQKPVSGFDPTYQIPSVQQAVGLLSELDLAAEQQREIHEIVAQGERQLGLQRRRIEDLQQRLNQMPMPYIQFIGISEDLRCVRNEEMRIQEQILSNLMSVLDDNQRAKLKSELKNPHKPV